MSSLVFQSSLRQKMELVALLLLLFLCLVTVTVLWFFLAAPRAALHCAIVAFPDHTHLLFEDNLYVASYFVDLLMYYKRRSYMIFLLNKLNR